MGIIELVKHVKCGVKAKHGIENATIENYNSQQNESLAEQIKPGADLSNAAQYIAALLASSNKIYTTQNFNNTVKLMGDGFQFLNLSIQTPILINSIRNSNYDKIIESTLAEAASIAGVVSIFPPAKSIAVPANLMLTGAAVGYHYKNNIGSAVKSAMAPAAQLEAYRMNSLMHMFATRNTASTKHITPSLTTPSTEASNTTPATPSKPMRIDPSFEEKANYVVQKKDTLEKIAEKTLHDSSRWSEIQKLNKDKIVNANKIFPGQNLLIPEMKANDLSDAALKIVQAQVLKNLTKHMESVYKPHVEFK